MLISIVAIKFVGINSRQSEWNDFSFIDKLRLPFYEYSFYIFKLILPINLCAIYAAPSFLEIYLFAAFFITISIFVFLKRNKFINLAWFCYIIVLLPVLQVIPNANALVADRYSYMSSVPLFAAICFWADGNNFFQKNVKLISTAIILFLAIVSYSRCKLWKNDSMLFTDVLQKNIISYTAYTNLGMYYLKENNANGALVYLRQAVELKPNNPILLTNYGWALAITDQSDLSLKILLASADNDPLYFKTWNNLGVVLGIKRKYRLSLKSLLLAKKLNPTNAEIYYNLAITYVNLTMNELAIKSYQQAAKMGLTQAQQFLTANHINW